MEQNLFGIYRPSLERLRIDDSTHIPLKTGVPGVKLLKSGPKHIIDCEEFEPLYVPQDNIMEDCLRREAERIANQDILINKIVYDCSEADPGKKQPEGDQQAEPEVPEWQDGRIPSIPTKSDCDNDEDFPPWYQLKGPKDTTLQFESRFECANLKRAIQIYDYEYDLILRPDYFTKGQTQWFYFMAKNTRAGKLYRFNIINLLKPDSLYNHGMKPLVYSEIDA